MANETAVKCERICRTCLNNDGTFYSLFEGVSDSVLLRNMVSAVTGLQIENDDHLPSVVCECCKEAATNAYEFKKKSVRSDQVLKGIIQIPTAEEGKSTELSPRDHHDFPQKSCSSDQVLKGILATLPNEIKVSFKEVKNDLGKLNKFNCEDVTADTSDLDDSFNINMDDLSDYLQDDLPISTFKAKDELTCHICGKKYKSKKAFYNHAKVCVKDEDVDGYFVIPVQGYPKTEDITSKRNWENSHCTDAAKKRTATSKKGKTKICEKKHDEEFLNCMFCEAIYTKRYNLINHLKTHKDIVIYYCGACSKMYLEKSQLLSHTCGRDDMNSKEEQVEPSNTSSCFSEINVEQIIDSFNESESEVVLHNCSECSMLLKSDEDLLEHIETDHPDKSLRCIHCLKSFSYKKAASRHREVCSKNEHKFRCNICQAGFQYEISLNRHILGQHHGEGVSVSHRRTATRPELTEHVESNILSESIFPCMVCHKQFARKDNLKTHMRVHVPTSERPRPASAGLCLYCGRSFTSSSNLIVHMRRHTGEKPYKCEFCGKGFPRSSDLQCHRRTHTGEKPCVCKVCGKAFSRSNKLTRHMRTHTGVKPYKCTYCDKAFAQSNDLTLHIRRHTGDKPYICEFCGDRFIQGTALQNHRRAHGHFPASNSEARPRPKANELLKVYSQTGDQS